MEHVRAAERKLLLYLNEYPGFLGLDVIATDPGRPLIRICWLENVDIPGIPAVVNNVQVFVVPTSLGAPEPKLPPL